MFPTTILVGFVSLFIIILSTHELVSAKETSSPISCPTHSTGAYISSLASYASRKSNRKIRNLPEISSLKIRSAFWRDEAESSLGMSTSQDVFDFDYLVIGAGSGGIASARRAASYGAKVALVEANEQTGGTCVNVGCVPKKVMWNAATIAETIHDMSYYGFAGAENVSLDWSYLKMIRDRYVERLNGIYDRNLNNSGVTFLRGRASFDSSRTVRVSSKEGGESYSARHILIATGSCPDVPDGEGISENSITSNGFFELEALPSKCVVVGAGYIAVELAGILNTLGSETNLILRKKQALRDWDEMLRDGLDKEMSRQGIQIHRDTGGVERIDVSSSTGNQQKTVYLRNGESISDVDVVIVATGRRPNVDGLDLESIGVLQNPGGYIDSNEYSETNLDGIYALGDVVGKVELTPMAIAAGRRLADRLFGGPSFVNAKVSYDLVPTVVFSHPPMGTIGLTEIEAVDKFGSDKVQIYSSQFVNLYYGPWQDIESAEKPQTFMKVVCAGDKEIVVGLHVLGKSADEILQGFAVAVRMGATKADLDATLAIHPTAGEEFVTLHPWGQSPQQTGAIQSPLNGSPPPEP